MKRRWNVVRRVIYRGGPTWSQDRIGPWQHSITRELTEHELRTAIEGGWGRPFLVRREPFDGLRLILSHIGVTGYVTHTEFYVRPLAD